MSPRRRMPGRVWRRGAGFVAALALVAFTSAVAGATGHVETGVAFDALAGELPEGIAITKRGDIYVSLTFLREIRRIGPDRSQSLLATLGPGSFGVLGPARAPSAGPVARTVAC